jgi:hypothetical protein
MYALRLAANMCDAESLRADPWPSEFYFSTDRADGQLGQGVKGRADLKVPPISYTCVESTDEVDYRRRAATCQADPIGDSPGTRGLLCPRRCERHPWTVPPGLAVRHRRKRAALRAP